jgi:hypothetical protein
MRPRRLGISAVLALVAVMVLGGLCSAQAGAGGNSAGYLFLKLDDLNTELVAAGFNSMPKGMLAWGGYGVGQIGDGKWSIGGVGMGGSAKSPATDDDDPKTATLDIGYGGILVQYNAWSSDKASLGLGAVLGAGTATLTTRRGSIDDFDELLGAGNSASLWRPYLMVQPQASIAFPVSMFADVRITGGYSFFYAPIGWLDGMNFRNAIDKGPLKTMGIPFIEVGIAFGGPMIVE